MLSRNELYAPLVAYEQTDVEPSSYMINQASTPKTMQESSLISFLQGISQGYHREEALSNDPKNNGSRPTSLTDIESKIKQRAVAIVGGKATSAMTSTSGAYTKNRKRKREEKSWKDIEEVVKQQSKAISLMPSRSCSTAFLRELNANWNEYIHSALNLNINVDHPSAITSRFTILRDDLELVGAHTRIVECTQRKGLSHRFGVLLGEKKNTWLVATLQSRRKRKIIVVSNTENEGNENNQHVDVVLVPKRGTTLALVVPLTIEKASNNETDPSRVADDEGIIGLSQNSLCIVVNPDKSNL